VAIRALRWRVFVDGDRSSFDRSRLRVALHAGHICVAAGQRQSSFCVVIEGRRRPSQRIVTIGAMRRSTGHGELPAVYILMARLTLLRRSGESRLVRRARLVASGASDRAVRAQQRKLRLRMVEPADIRPRFRRVARFTAKERAIRPFLLHARGKFAVMHVAMARRAGPVFEMKREHSIRSPAKSDFVTFSAGHGQMRSGQDKMSFFMLRNRKGRAVKIRHGMATLAAILIRRRRELPCVSIFVAIRALGERYFVVRISARRGMAAGTSYSGVFAFQRVRGIFVHL